MIEVAHEYYHRFPDTRVIVCCLELRNGYLVTGESVCPANVVFDEEHGRRVAKRKAMDKIHPLEMYAELERS